MRTVVVVERVGVLATSIQRRFECISVTVRRRIHHDSVRDFLSLVFAVFEWAVVLVDSVYVGALDIGGWEANLRQEQ